MSPRDEHQLSNHNLYRLSVILAVICVFVPFSAFAQDPPPSNECCAPPAQESCCTCPQCSANRSAGDGGQCNCCGCREKRAKLATMSANPYRAVFYDNDFSYLDDPGYDDRHLGERLKRLNLFGVGVLDIGGEFRARYHSENNMRGQGLTGRSDDFLLQRNRLFFNGEIGSYFRAFAEFYDASSEGENFPARGNEENRADFLNIFGDLVIWRDGDNSFTLRGGRQELFYGDGRLIAPALWSNTRRKFDGAKVMVKYDDWSVDGFWTQPVIVNPRRFDSPDAQQDFYGVWATYHGWQNRELDLYWLGNNDDSNPYPAGGALHFQTLGARYQQACGPWSFLLQGGYQFGDFANLDHSAGMMVGGVGRNFDDAVWTPTVWLYYDYASGGQTIGDAYNALFPLGHRYLGFMDFFSRMNLQDLNLLTTAKPYQWLDLLMWWHVFWLEDNADVPYNVPGAPVALTPGGNPHLGTEVDLVADVKLTDRSKLLLGYSHFFTGDWYRTNPSARNGFTGDANFFYTQFRLRW